MEQQHQKLAELLKFRPTAASHQDSLTSLPRDPPLKAPPQASLPLSPTENELASSRTQHTPLPIKLPQRELGSSIASNLASARGIPSGRQRRGNHSPAQISPQHADGKLSLPRQRSKLSEQEVSPPLEVEKEEKIESRQSKSPSIAPIARITTSPDKSTASTLNTIPQPQATSEDSFSRFYATFEGLLSKLSAPLAFAGLPLTPEEPPKPEVKAEKSKSIARDSTEPDVRRMFSRAALRALRGEHGPTNGTFGGAESFYVVPTTGGTISYAGILSRAEREARLAAGEEDDEFVDARETLQQTSPGPKRKGLKPGMKTMEELQLENEALRALADDLSIRLHRFEMGAQNSSMALAMSMRALQSPTTSVAGQHPSTGSAEKMKELEEQVAATKKEKEKLKRENDKLKTVVERYREKWEKLKDGARERMAVAGAGKEDPNRS